jgi:hypothetical protein
MEAPTTYLAPGQRYIHAGHDWTVDAAVTILRVGPDAARVMWVIFGAADGAEYARPAAGFEAAIASGVIVPIASWGTIGWC